MPRPEHTISEQYTFLELRDGSVRRMTREEIEGESTLPAGSRRFMPDNISSQGAAEAGSEPFHFENAMYGLPPNTHWKTSTEGLTRLAGKGRLYPIGRRLRYR